MPDRLSKRQRRAMPRIERKYLVIAAIGLLLGLYTVAGFYAVPRWVRSQAQAFVAQQYGRTLSLGEIRFNPYRFTLEVRDALLPDADGQPLLAFERLLINLDVSSVWRRGLSCGAIELERPQARALLRPDGTLNLAELSKPFTANAASSKNTEPARIFIDELRVTSGELQFQDSRSATPFRARLQPITFELRDFSTTGRTDNAYALQAQSVAGERFEWHGTLGVNPLASRGRFSVHNLKARTLWEYLRDSLGFEVSSGVLAFAGDYELSSSPTLQLNAGIRTLGITDLAVRPRGGALDYARLIRVQVDDTRVDLTAHRVAIGKVRIDGADVNLWRDEQGAFNFSQLVSAAHPTASAAATPSTSEPPTQWHIAVPDVAIDGAKIAFEDRHVAPAAHVRIDPISVQLSGFSNASDASVDVNLALRINDAGELKARGTVIPMDSAVQAQLEVANLDLTALQPYIAERTQMTLLSGLFGATLAIERTKQGVLGVAGNLELAKLHTIDNALRQDFIKWDLLRVAKLDYRSDPARLRIGTVEARNPYARVVIAPNRTLNVNEVLARTPAQEQAAARAVVLSQSRQAPAAQAKLAAAIGTVRITNGSANFADFWITPNYAVSIQGLNGTIVGLSSQRSSRAKIELNGKVDRYAPTHISGEVNLLSASLYSDLKLSFKGVEMTSVTPYSGRFAGYRIEKGKLSVDLAYHVEDRQLRADQRFVIDQLQLGDRVESPDAVKLPLQLAVAVLKDRNGVIDVGLPLSGSLDDPQFRLGPIIWKAVVNVLTKCVTAPFAVLGNLFDGGEEMNLIDFPPGEAKVAADGQERLAALKKALLARPHLQLDVPAAYASDLDGAALAKQRLESKLAVLARQSARKASEPDSLTDPAQRFDLLLRQYRQDFGTSRELPALVVTTESARKKKSELPDFSAANAVLEQALVAKQPIALGDLESLGKLRAQTVQEALLGDGQIDPSRVFIIAAKQPKSAEGKVRLEMSLK